MRFTRLSLRDFISYDAQELDLQGLDYVAIAGQNGSGKSTIALAISWALFGTARVKGDSDSVIRDGQAECSVILEFEADGAQWRIERAKKRAKSAKVRLYSKDSDGRWDPYGDHLNATAQARIEELVGMSEDAFYSLTVIDGQSGMRFIKADSHLRRDILLNLLPEMGVWAELENSAREMLSEARSSVAAEQARLEVDETRLAQAREDVVEAEAEYEDLDPDDLREQLADVDDDIAVVVKRIENATAAEAERLDRAERAHDKRTHELSAAHQEAKSEAQRDQSVCDAIDTVVEDLDAIRQEVADIDAETVEARQDAKVAAGEYEALASKEDEGRRLDAEARKVRELAAVAKAQASADKKSLSGLRDMQHGHVAECPTCRTGIDEEALTALIDRLDRAVEQALAEADEHHEQAEALAQKAADIFDAMDAAAKKADRADAAVDRLVRDAGRAKKDVERYEKRLAEALSEGGFANVSQAHKKAEQSHRVAEAAREALDDYVTQARKDLEELQRALDDAKASAAEGKDGRVLAELRESKRDLAERIRAADSLSGRLETLRSSVRSTTESMRERQDAIKDTVERIGALEIVLTACRPQGIPSMLLDGVLAPIEAEATRILNSVPGGEGMTVRFEQVRALKSREGGREVLDIIVTLPGGTQRPIESLSAGETVRVSLALVFAMISVLGARRGGDSLDTVFLDEPLGPLDQEAVPAFVEVLRSAVSSGSLSSVMVVTHDQRVVEALPQRIEVERSETGVSRATIVS